MIFFRKIREAIGTLLLRSRLKRQDRRVIMQPLNKMKTAAILFDASQESNYRNAIAFAKELMLNKTKVEVLGYINASKQTMPFISDQMSTFVTLKAFSSFFLPKSQDIKTFTTEPFDALFVLTANSYFPLKALIYLSAAHLKVGFTGVWEDALDLTFDLPDANSNELVKQINYYLGHIKTK